MRYLRTLLVLGRVSNLPTVWTNCLVGMVVAGGGLAAVCDGSSWMALFIPEKPGGEAWGVFPAWSFTMGCVMLGVSLLYVGGMYLNDYADVKWDREHAPERPIPSGAISENAVLYLAVLWMGGGGLVLYGSDLWEGAGSSVVWVGVLFFAIVAYDFLHKKWVGSVGLMGLCRFAVYPVAATAVLGGGNVVPVLPPALWWVAAGMFFYVVGVTLAAKGERSGGVVKRVAWVCLLVPVVVWVWLGVTGLGVLVLVVMAWWWWRTAGHLRVKADKNRVGGFVSGLLAGIVVVDALMVSAVDARAAWICLAMLPVCLVLQRKVPAT
ncbi:MAG: UbiA family prenyltransferase [Verrucomicrobiota bacterium]